MKTPIVVCALVGLWLSANAGYAETARAVFAGGCFWCMEADFEKQEGVVSVVSGYTGGHVADPDYKQVTGGNTGHYEAVQIDYDPAVLSYEKLLAVFWRNIDPLDDKGQFCDKGSSYRSAVFALNEQQMALAEQSKQQRQKALGEDKAIVTPIIAAGKFYPAEAYHQDYYRKNPLRYNYYRRGCGRDKRLEQLWGPPEKTH